MAIPFPQNKKIGLFPTAAAAGERRGEMTRRGIIRWGGVRERGREENKVMPSIIAGS